MNDLAAMEAIAELRRRSSSGETITLLCFCKWSKDESRQEIWPEIQSRFLITSPNINQDKVHDGNVLIAQRKGLPNAIQQQIIVSDKERKLPKKAVSFIKGWMRRLFQSNMLDYDHANTVWIPYNYILGDALKSERGTDNRITNRIFSLLNIIPLTKVHHRQPLWFIMRDQSLPRWRILAKHNT